MGILGRKIGVAALLFALVAAVGIVSSAREVPTGDLPLENAVENSGGAASLLVRVDEAVVRISPDGRSKRRGVAMGGSRLPVFESREGPGCSGYWYRVHESGWLCERDVEPSPLSPESPRYPVVPEGQIAPWPYAFVRTPTIEYTLVGGMLEEVRELLEGFGFGVAGTAHIEGRSLLKTVAGNYVPRGDAGITSRVSAFRGIEIADGKGWPLGWINAKTAWAYGAPSKKKKDRLYAVDRYRAFEVRELVGEGRRRFVRFEDAAYFSAVDTRMAATAPRPETVGSQEKWIDVDVAQQVVTAYVGDVPVYATLASTGRAGPSKTVLGEYRIWAKVAAIAMDNTEETIEAMEQAQLAGAGEPVEEVKLYSLHDVPWTQFFHESYALHGVYWHDRFGNRRSHGCVNLSPSDARWFYEWTEPKVPDGFWAIHAADPKEGTLVRIR